MPEGLEDELGGLGSLLAAAKERLAAAEVEVSAGGGAVRVRMDGEKRLRAIEIAPEAIEGDGAELAELILAAINEAWERADEVKSSAIGSLVPGFGLR